MSDAGADLEAAEEMVFAAIDRLVAKDSSHELVHFIFIENGEEQERAWQAILRRFSKDPGQQGGVRGVMELVFAMTRYLMALEVALGERILEPVLTKQNKAVSEFQQHGWLNISDDLPF